MVMIIVINVVMTDDFHTS